MRHLVFLISFISAFAASLSGQSYSGGYYDTNPVPPFILEQFGPFGPQDKTYVAPVGAIFVAPDGKDSNTGDSIAEPTTIEWAIANAKTGDTIVMRGGLYRTGQLSFATQITIQPYLDEQPVLKGSRVAINWEKRGEHWATPWEKLYPQDPPPYYNPERHGPPCLWNQDLVVVDGVMLTPVGALGELTDDTFFCDYEQKAVYLANNPSGKTVEITYYEFGLLRTHDSDSDPVGPTIDGIDILQYSAQCIAILGDDPYRTIELHEMPEGPIGTRIVNCRALMTPRTGVRVISPQSYIAYNDISRHGSVCMTVRMSHDSVFEHNIVNGGNIFQHRSFPSGIKVFNQSHAYITRNNIFDDMTCIALWYDVGHRESVIYDNYFRNCGKGLKIEISHRAYIANNVFDRSELFLCNAGECEVFNNTLIDSRMDIMRNNRGIRWNKRFSFNHAATGPGIYGYHGHKIANNIFAGNPRDDILFQIDDRNEHDPEFPAELITNNLFAGTNNIAFEAQFQPNDWPMTQFKTLEEFDEVYGEFVSGNEQIEIDLNALFHSRQTGDLRLNDLPGLIPGTAIPYAVAQMLGWKTVGNNVGAFGHQKGVIP
ncbi:MAG: NosD domain-containing protein [Verrucomicrobiota bacterium]